MVSTAQQPGNKKRRNMNEYELRVLNGITRHIYFFHQKFYQTLFIFQQFNKFFSSKLPNFTAKLAIH